MVSERKIHCGRPNGRTIQEGTYAEGYREGAWCDRTFVDGEISSEGIEVYKDGLKNGVCRALTYEDGTISSESIETYKDGLLDGYLVGEPIIDGFLDLYNTATSMLQRSRVLCCG